jgi:signal transduction histidine kinase
MPRFGVGAKLLLGGLLFSILPLALFWFQVDYQLSRVRVLLVADSTEQALALADLDLPYLVRMQAQAHAESIGVLITETIDRMARISLLMTLMVSLLLVVLVRRLVKDISGPLERLEHAVGEWDGTTPLDLAVEGNDEVAEVTRAVSQMSAKVAGLRAETKARATALEAADKELTALNVSLEKTIEQRTRRLQEALDKLRSLDRHKDDFLSLITHELKTPLTSISACAEALSGRVDLPEPSRKQFLQIILDETDRLTRLINDVLDYSRVSAGRLPFMFRSIDLIALAGQAVLSHRPAAEQKEVKVRFNRSDDPDPRLVDVKADPDRLFQVMTNLLGNALKFTPPGGKITVSTSILEKVINGRERAFARVSVNDTGSGIPPEDRNKVFERFAQAGQMDHHSEGTGLGLPIARGIIREHGGKIWFTSKPEVGTTFYFTIPVDRDNVVPRTPDSDEGTTN